MPVRQELSAEELAYLKRQAAEEAAGAARAGGGDFSDDDDDDDVAPKTAAITMDDPAFASLRDVQLPAGMELDSDEDDEEGDNDEVNEGSGDDDDDSDSDDHENANKKGRRKGLRSKAVRAGLRADQVEKKALGSRMADIDAPEAFDDDEDEDEEDVDDLTAKPDDAFLLVASTEDDHSSLELQCYNTVDGSLYVHHDITLPAFPLCVAWMDYAGDAAAKNAATQAALMAGASLSTVAAGAAGHVGSYVAVGTFKPHIEIWNTDVLDPLEPTLVLRGGGSAAPAKTARGRRQRESGEESSLNGSGSAGHIDAVLGLAWNRSHRHMLASASADTTVKVWDLDGGGRVLHTFTHHKDKVHSVAWHDSETSILASASFDRTAAVTDARVADKASARVARFALPSTPESLLWYVHNPTMLLASCEDGSLLGWDVRHPNAPLFNLKAHKSATTSVAASHLARGLLATGSKDKSVKLWDLNVASATTYAPVCIASKVMTIGQVFTVSFFANSPFLLAAGGSKGICAVWDIAADGGETTPAALASSGGGGGGADAGSDGGGGASSLLPEGASSTARRFAGRFADPGAVPSLQIRPRADGQPLA